MVALGLAVAWFTGDGEAHRPVFGSFWVLFGLLWIGSGLYNRWQGRVGQRRARQLGE